MSLPVYVLNSHTDETMFSITVEVFLPFLVAGFGMVGAGVVLDIVQHWPVFEELDQLFILVPALLGLKGNLEMTLASRLSTQVRRRFISYKITPVKYLLRLHIFHRKASHGTFVTCKKCFYDAFGYNAYT